MTWYYDPSETAVDVYDHTGTLVGEDVNFSGSWSDTPEPVFDTMADVARDAAARGDLRYAAEVFADAVADDIEEGTP